MLLWRAGRLLKVLPNWQMLIVRPSCHRFDPPLRQNYKILCLPQTTPSKQTQWSMKWDAWYCMCVKCPVFFAYGVIEMLGFPEISVASGSVDICWLLGISMMLGFFFLVCMCSVSFPSAVSCVVSEWMGWSGCAEPCRATVRRRSRTILQEPLNAGQPCPHLEEHAGCAEYWSQQGHCHNSLGEFLLVCKIK